MAEMERCNEEFWGVECDKPPGHGSAHSASKYGSRITWGAAKRPPTNASDSGGREGHKATRADLARRSQELAEDRRRLLQNTIDTGDSVRQTHERVAGTMDRLADKGDEHESRRRRLAEMSREFAEEEVRHLAALRKDQVGDQSCEGAEPNSD